MDGIGPKARRPNPALDALAFLVGDWRTTGSHPEFPGKALAGRTSFGWHEQGAFLIMRSEVDQPGFPDGVAIIGSDGDGRFAMTYFDERGVSRILDVAVDGRTVTWTHADAKFAQTLEIRAEGDDRLVSTGRMSRDGGPWTEDLSQRFDRIGSGGQEDRA